MARPRWHLDYSPFACSLIWLVIVVAADCWSGSGRARRQSRAWAMNGA